MLETVNFKSLRYVLYARKSTEDDSRQVRSIDDQIADCLKMQNNLGLNVVEIIKEKKSAKKPGQRKEFERMLEGIRSKKYDAILCWHPDRLSRNMLESGMLIDMLDEHVLKDIRFQSHEFSNDPNGKMLLGMLFVFSKQYSDDLSAKVTRGVQGNLNEGKSAGTPKLGYTRNEGSGLYEENSHYNAVRRAWDMRLKGSSLVDITDFMLTKDVHRTTKTAGRQRKLYPTKSTVSNMFRDPFYYGELVQSSQTVNLADLYGFEPMVTKDEWDAVQYLGYGRTKDSAQKKRYAFLPLRGVVFCAICNSPKYMIAGKNLNGSKIHVLTYRCDNKACTRKPKSMRAYKVFDSLYTVLESLNFGDAAYERYSTEIDSITGDKLVEIKGQVLSKKGYLSHIQKEIKTRSLAVGDMNSKTMAYKINMAKVEELAGKKIDTELEIQKLEERLIDPDQIRMTKEEFLNVAKTASDKMRAGSAIEKDALFRILFLNVKVDNEKIVDYIWNEPFVTMVKLGEIEQDLGKIQVGGAGWT